MNRRKSFSALLLAFVMLTGCSRAPAEEEPFSLETIRLGDDFYGWCNAERLYSMELADGCLTAGSFDEMDMLVNTQVDSVIKEVAAQNTAFPPGSDEQLVHDLYHLALRDADSDYDETLVTEVIDYVNGAQDWEQLCQVWGDLYYFYGTSVVLRPSIEVDLYDRTTYQVWMPQFNGFDGNLLSALGDAQMAAYYRNDYALMLTLAGTEEAEAYDRADQMMYMLLDIAAAADPSLTNAFESDRIWHPYTEDELNARARNLEFEDLMWLIGAEANPTGQVILYDPEQYFVIDSLLDDAHLQVWKDCTICAFLENYRKELPPSFDALSYRSEEEPEQFALSETRALLEYKVGALYAKKYQNQEVCKAVERICHDVIDEYARMIDGADWLSDEGKAALTEKLRGIICYVGADISQEPIEEDAALIGETLLDTAINFKAIEPQSIGVWLTYPAESGGDSLLLPQEVNAIYDPRDNTLLVTTAFLNPPFFRLDADAIENLAGVGDTIAHEISHAFDSEGIKFNAEGNYDPEWLPEADRTAFQERMQRTADYYSRFSVFGSSHVNGTLTLTENLADIGGLQCVLGLAKTPEEKKKLFECYSRNEGTLYSENYIQSLLMDNPHSPASIRVNAVVACFDEFYELYDVQPGDALYVAPEDRLRRW